MNEIADISERGRSLVDREEGLINNRIGWLLTSQTIFFAGFGIGSGQLNNILAYVAVTSCSLIYISILAGLVAMRHFRTLYSHHEVIGPRATHMCGLATPFLLPPIFVVVWTLFVLKQALLCVVIVLVWFIAGIVMSHAAHTQKTTARGKDVETPALGTQHTAAANTVGQADG